MMNWPIGVLILLTSCSVIGTRFNCSFDNMPSFLTSQGYCKVYDRDFFLLKTEHSMQRRSKFKRFAEFLSNAVKMASSALPNLGNTLSGLLSKGSKSSDEYSNRETDRSSIQEKLDTFKQKNSQEDTATDNVQKTSLGESLGELQISNDISFQGFDEFKMSDVKISVIEDTIPDATGTTIPVNFPSGIGLYIASECYREVNHPDCSELFEKYKNTKQQACGTSMIPSAHVIGTGFLITKDALDKTRRKSLISRLCNKPIKYGGYLIPDGITIAEIYDSEAHSVFFTESRQFANYLSSSYGVAITNEELNSFSASITGGMETFGEMSVDYEKTNKKSQSETSSDDQIAKSEIERSKLLTLFEINVIRYALSVETMQPDYIDPFFLVDFMTLPESYFEPNAVEKYQKFIFRYGTHYIHSAQFGGQVLFENTRVVDTDADVNEIAKKAWQETQSAFGSSVSLGGSASINGASLGGGIKSDSINVESGVRRDESLQRETTKKERKWINMLLQTQGGDVKVASLITRLESNTGPELIDWLKSISKYPKAFKIKMKPISELIDFNVRDLFIRQENLTTCRPNRARVCLHGDSVEKFQQSFEKRRKSLDYAIDIFRHKNEFEFTDLEIPPGTAKTCLFSIDSKSNLFPSYDEILNGTEIKIILELDSDYEPFYQGEEIYVMFHNDLWFSRARGQSYNFLRTYKMPQWRQNRKPIVIRNLVFNYNETTGALIFKDIGSGLESHLSLSNVKEVKKMSNSEHWKRGGVLRNMHIGQVNYVNILQGIHKASGARYFIIPCNLDWSTANSRRFAVSLQQGKCLRFVASSYGDIFVVFATNPNNQNTWYYVQISSYGVALYRAGMVVKYRIDSNAGSLRDPDLFRRFFVCMNYESRKNVDNKLQASVNFDKVGVFIQYGIVQGYDSREVVKLSYFDENPLEPRFYMFGNYDFKVSVYDITVDIMTLDEEAELRCSKKTLDELDEDRCRFLCHENCHGCSKFNQSDSCAQCRFHGELENNELTCYDQCQPGYIKTDSSCEDIDECDPKYSEFILNKPYDWTGCSNTSLCVNHPGSFECQCPSGYEGDGYECNDIDECSDINLHNCPDYSICINHPGHHECKCLAGFYMNQTVCEDVDECAIGMSMCNADTSVCLNTHGSYRCVCRQGFISNEVECQDINECQLQLHTCPPRSTCVNTRGAYVCVIDDSDQVF